MNLQNDESQPMKLRLDAARELLDRGAGKPLNSSVTLAEERIAEDPIGTLDRAEAADLLDAIRDLRGRKLNGNKTVEETNGDA